MPPVFTLQTVDQGHQAHLFRLPIELRQRIYQYVLTPTHVHIERKVDYRLTPDGIRIAGSIRRSSRQTTAVPAEDDNALSWPEWHCRKIFVDPSTSFEINDRDTRRDARRALFNIYHCRSQRSGGPSAVPPGYMDHEHCSGNMEQVAFSGSNMLGLMMTCQWAYNDARNHGLTTGESAAVGFTPFLTRNSTQLELGSHNLHFSDLQDVVCWTSLVTPQLSESLSKLSVHVDDIWSPYWRMFCQVHLQPWARSCFTPWEWHPNDRHASITFYHNHTTHDLANAQGDQEDRDEVAEALASTWVVPNIQFDSDFEGGSSWSTKFRMSALRGRAGGPLDLRLSFPTFLRRESSPPLSRTDHASFKIFDHRRWLSERHYDKPIAEKYGPWRVGERRPTAIHRPTQTRRGRYPETMSEMEYTLLSKEYVTYMMQVKRWFDENPDARDSPEWAQNQREYDRLFVDTFLQSRRLKSLDGVHPQLGMLDNCQGFEKFEIDFYGDANSPGTVQEVQNYATEIWREGLQERFTGRGWTSSNGLEKVESLFWNIGPHPEVNFTRWADPDGNMRGLNMDEAW
ncbi:hypothetical protein E8E14_006035 [Neopestalotiopsis sp. 37M]|nr:hypothetical protein E8E14_006035 [Neopestalotiopsis sp. 37M]